VKTQLVKRLPAAALAAVFVCASAAHGGVAGKSFSGSFTTATGQTASSCMRFESGSGWAFDQDFGGGRQGFEGSYSELDFLFLSFWSARPDGVPGTTMSGVSFFGFATSFVSAGSVPAEGFYFVSGCSPVQPVEAEGVHVALSGSDTSGCGDADNPCRTIKAGIQNASWGSTVLVHAGTYEEDWIFMKSGVRVLSADGPLAARIDSGQRSAVRFEQVDRALLDGFEISGDHNQGPLADGLVRVHMATNVAVRNSVIHDAPADCDVIKVTYVDGLLLENLVVYNPALRFNGYCATTYQENIDLFGSPGSAPPVRNVTVRGCWVFHTEAGGDYLLYSKRNTENVLFENNVFGPSSALGCGNPAVSIGTDEDSQGAYHIQHAIVRNNVFVGLNGDAALAVMNANDVWIYNNTFYRNSGAGLRSVIMFRGNQIAMGAVNVLGNVFVENQPGMLTPIFYWNRDAAPSPFRHDHNLYLGNLAATDLAYTGEPNSRYGLDPLLEAPGIPSTSSPNLTAIGQIMETFRLLAGSPGVDAGLDVVSQAGHPHWEPVVTDVRADTFGTPRPTADTWDLGVHERER